MSSRNVNLVALKNKISDQLLEADRLSPLPGISTGLQQLDQFLPNGGFPKQQMTLVKSLKGWGATSFWCRSAQRLNSQKKWSCWIECDAVLHPQSLPSTFVDRSRLLVVHPPRDNKKAFFSLKEILSSELFELVGLDFSELHFSTFYWAQILKLVEKHHVALVVLNEQQPRCPHHFFSLVLQWTPEKIVVEKVRQRAVPYTIGRSTHESFVSQIAEKSAALLG